MRQLIVLSLFAFLICTFVQGRVIRDAKSDLITRGNTLLKSATDAIKKLETQNKTAEIAIVKKDEADIEKLIKELQAATTADKITAIEHSLRIAESRLFYELYKIEHPRPDLKEILIIRAKAYQKQAEELEAKLKAINQSADAELIAKELVVIQKLVKDLTEAKTAQAIAHLETELQSAEFKFSTLLHNIYVKDFKGEILKGFLLQKAKSLESYVEDAITKLKALKKTDEVAKIEKESKLVTELVKKLEVAKTIEELSNVEKQLNEAENVLYAELRKVSNWVHQDKLKELLLTRAKKLETEAKAVIDKLKKEKKDSEAKILEKELLALEKLMKDLTDAKTDEAISKAEKDLNHAETVLSAEIRKINGHHFA